MMNNNTHITIIHVEYIILTLRECVEGVRPHPGKEGRELHTHSDGSRVLMKPWGLHPATAQYLQQEAACIGCFMPFGYKHLTQAVDALKLKGPAEWSVDLVSAEMQAGYLQLPLDAATVEPRDVGTVTSPVLTEFARACFKLFNRLNMKLSEWLPPCQLLDAELTFYMGGRHSSAHLFHVDCEENDNRTAVFIVSLRKGSRATILSEHPTKCGSTLDAGVGCTRTEAGAASYFPLHICHTRPSHTLPNTRRDVAAVHVHWSVAPPAVLLARFWETELSSAEENTCPHGMDEARR